MMGPYLMAGISDGNRDLDVDPADVSASVRELHPQQQPGKIALRAAKGIQNCVSCQYVHRGVQTASDEALDQIVRSRACQALWCHAQSQEHLCKHLQCMMVASAHSVACSSCGLCQSCSMRPKEYVGKRRLLLHDQLRLWLLCWHSNIGKLDDVVACRFTGEPAASAHRQQPSCSAASISPRACGQRLAPAAQHSQMGQWPGPGCHLCHEAMLHVCCQRTFVCAFALKIAASFHKVPWVAAGRGKSALQDMMAASHMIQLSF